MDTHGVHAAAVNERLATHESGSCYNFQLPTSVPNLTECLQKKTPQEATSLATAN